jgi:dTDP-3-amino-2,3,6-trideoxy-4-keto-D-glucose/dTDP-3-amino-3,4,6-trideoxy-alpha-D-glucose/dTDP-2,6-dideoxy-D-kanosamine transaminase
MIPLNDLSRIDAVTLASEIEAVSKVISSGNYMMGPHSSALEAAISNVTLAAGTVTVGNGTDALMLAMQGLGVEQGDLVATVPNAGGYATAAAIKIGARPILVDIDPVTLQMSTDSLRRVLSNNKLAAVVATHLYGLMADIEMIRDICDEAGIQLIEDCAQAFGATFNCASAGSWGDAATFSFYPTKNLGALGDGGAISFKELNHLSRARQLAQYGWSTRYEVSLLGGVNSRIDEIQAAVLLLRLQKVDEENRKRRDTVKLYSESLSGKRKMVFNENESFVGHLAVLVTDSREKDQETLNAAGIATGIHYPILDNDQPAWKSIFENQTTPIAVTYSQKILTLPCFPRMTENEIQLVCKTLTELG